jgi:hypothetical protein
MVKGNFVLKAAAVSLSDSVAVKTVVPIVMFIFATAAVKAVSGIFARFIP